MTLGPPTTCPTLTRNANPGKAEWRISMRFSRGSRGSRLIPPDQSPPQRRLWLSDFGLRNSFGSRISAFGFSPKQGLAHLFEQPPPPVFLPDTRRGCAANEPPSGQKPSQAEPHGIGVAAFAAGNESPGSEAGGLINQLCGPRPRLRRGSAPSVGRPQRGRFGLFPTPNNHQDRTNRNMTVNWS